MKIVAFVASARKEGNTTVLTREIVKAAQAQGAETSIVYLNDLTMRGCQGCMGCKKTGRCVLKDDMAPLYDQILAADAVVLASPIYMGGITGQLKTFIDRLYPFITPNLTSTLPKNKKAALVFTQGQPRPELYHPHFESLAGFMKFLGFSVCEPFLVGTSAREPGVIAQNPAAMEAARTLGRQLVGK